MGLPYEWSARKITYCDFKARLEKALSGMHSISGILLETNLVHGRVPWEKNWNNQLTRSIYYYLRINKTVVETSPQLSILLSEACISWTRKPSLLFLILILFLKLLLLCFIFITLSFVFLGPHPQHMEVPRLGIKSELQVPAYTTVIATWGSEPEPCLWPTPQLMATPDH